MDARKIASFLGWFSIGLGLTELLAPGFLARTLGVSVSRGGLRSMYGAREVAAGVAILSQPTAARWLWARVGGDLQDITTLATALTPDNPKRRNAAIALASVAGITALDVYCARELSRGAA